VAISDQAARYGQRRLMKRFGRSIPFLGTLVVIATIGAAVRRKGLIGGAIDSALNAIPFVGGMKNASEVVRGRDFIRDRKRHPV
jgi:hypothetical protein